MLGKIQANHGNGYEIRQISLLHVFVLCFGLDRVQTVVYSNEELTNKNGLAA